MAIDLLHKNYKIDNKQWEKTINGLYITNNNTKKTDLDQLMNTLIDNCTNSNHSNCIVYFDIIHNDKISNDQFIRNILIQVDVIEGEINSTNIGEIKCQYNDIKLGKSFELLKHKTTNLESEKKIFFKYTKKTKQKKLTNKTKKTN